MNVEFCREVVQDLRPANPRRYFLDLTLCATLGWAAFAGAVLLDALPYRLAAAFGAAIFLYRALAFIHELIHQQEMKAFRWFWHALAGVPLLLPLLLYLPVHQAHRGMHSYGTARDGEYEQFRGRLVRMTASLLLLNLALPAALLVRFAVLTPLGFVAPFVRREVIPAFVHLSLRMPFKAPEMRGAAAREAKWVEPACMLWAWALLAAAFAGHWGIVGWWALSLILVATLNTVRALCSTHLYVEQPQGRNTLGQVADSLNIEGGGLVTWLLCPVGLQYHALHHLAPFLPYHALDEAHRRLKSRLPADAVYRRVTVPSVYAGWRRLVEATAAAPDSAASRVTSG